MSPSGFLVPREISVWRGKPVMMRRQPKAHLRRYPSYAESWRMSTFGMLCFVGGGAGRGDIGIGRCGRGLGQLYRDKRLIALPKWGRAVPD